MIVRYLVQDPFHPNDTRSEYLLVFQVPEGSRNEQAFIYMLEIAGLEYIKIEAPPRKQTPTSESSAAELDT